MSFFNFILASFVIASVLLMVVDHRRGWLTQILVDGARFFGSPRVHESERRKRRPHGDDA